MTIIECYNSGLSIKKAASLCGISYDRAMKVYQDLHMEENSCSGILRRNLIEVNRIERDLFTLITQAEASDDPHLIVQIENQKILYSQFNALDIHYTI